MPKKSVRDIDVQGKTVLVRVDFNVPLEKGTGRVTDVTRLRASLPTIEDLRQRGARVVLMSHLGRPDGQVRPELSLAAVGRELARLLGIEVKLAGDCIGPGAECVVRELRPGEVALLENLRFHPGEEANDPSFAASLASLGDLYVNDAFGTAHRAHASTEGLAHILPAVAGLLMEKELAVLGGILDDPRRPLVAIIGGAKVSTKLGVLKHLVGRVDALLIGGGMANTFLKARGLEVGKSLLEVDLVPAAAELVQQAQRLGIRLLIASDLVVTDRVAAGAANRVVSADQVPTDLAIVDIGPRTVEAFGAEIDRAGTVLWNGPMGVFEIPEFASGTRAIAERLAASTAISVLGGGATLEFLEGLELPGVAALQEAE